MVLLALELRFLSFNRTLCSEVMIHIYYNNGNIDNINATTTTIGCQGYNKPFALLFRNDFFFCLFVLLRELFVHCLFIVLFACFWLYNISVDKPSVYPIVKKMKKFLVFIHLSMPLLYRINIVCRERIVIVGIASISTQTHTYYIYNIEDKFCKSLFVFACVYCINRANKLRIKAGS